MSNETEKNFIQRILGGETSLYAYFLNNYSHSVYTLIVRIVKSREDAEELTQDTFLKAFKKLDTYRGDSAFSSWLLRIAYNTAISAVRKQKMVFPVIDEILINTVEDKDVEELFGRSENEELLQHLEKAIEQLNNTDKALITLYYIQNKSIKELSEIFDFSEDNIKIKLFRIRKKLYIMTTKTTYEYE